MLKHHNEVYHIVCEEEIHRHCSNQIICEKFFSQFCHPLCDCETQNGHLYGYHRVIIHQIHVNVFLKAILKRCLVLSEQRLRV